MSGALHIKMMHDMTEGPMRKNTHLRTGGTAVKGNRRHHAGGGGRTVSGRTVSAYSAGNATFKQGQRHAQSADALNQEKAEAGFFCDQWIFCFR